MIKFIIAWNPFLWTLHRSMFPRNLDTQWSLFFIWKKRLLGGISNFGGKGKAVVINYSAYPKPPSILKTVPRVSSPATFATYSQINLHGDNWSRFSHRSTVTAYLDAGLLLHMHPWLSLSPCVAWSPATPQESNDLATPSHSPCSLQYSYDPVADVHSFNPLNMFSERLTRGRSREKSTIIVRNEKLN